MHKQLRKLTFCLTGKFLKNSRIFSSVASYGRFPINAVNGGDVGTLARSSGPRDAFGAVGNFARSTDDIL